jgi:hypothetical protein
VGVNDARVLRSAANISLGTDMNIRSAISALVFIATFGASTGAVYALFLPAFFPDYRTSWILILGILIPTTICGCLGYHAPKAGTTVVRSSVGLCYACVAAILVSFLSLFIILNIRGS